MWNEYGQICDINFTPVIVIQLTWLALISHRSISFSTSLGVVLPNLLQTWIIHNLFQQTIAIIIYYDIL